MKLVIGKTEYDVKPITIGDYEYFTENTEVDDLTLIDRLTTAPLDELKKAKFSQIKFISKLLRSRLDEGVNKSSLDLVCEIDGVKYGLIKPSELSYEEWVNLEVFMSEKPLNIGLISTHLYKPLKNDKMGDERELIDYDLNECKSRIELFKEKMPMGRILAAFFFIAIFVQKLTERFLDYTEQKQNENKNKGMKKQPQKK